MGDWLPRGMMNDARLRMEAHGSAVRFIVLLPLVLVILAGCGGESAATLSDDEQREVADAVGELTCIGEDYGFEAAGASTGARSEAADELAAIYRDNPDANYKPPAQKDEEPLEDVMKEAEDEVGDCDPGAASTLARARAEVATGD